MSNTIQLSVAKVSALELIAELQKEIDEFRKENGNLRKQVDVLTNTNEQLKEENQTLTDVITVLKRLNLRPQIAPSILEGNHPSPDNPKGGGEGVGKPKRGKHPRKNKKKLLHIHQEQIIQPIFIPEGAEFKGYKDFDVQDIVICLRNTRFKLARYQLADGTYISGELPQGVHGHYGSEMITYILNDYYGCNVTEGSLLGKLHQLGILISSGQLSNILTKNKNLFHVEKQELQPAGIKACNQILTDDTGGRHKGTNQYTNVIGNEWFSVFNTTDSKSRVNFLRLLQGGKHEYLINEDTLAYLEQANASSYLPGYISLSLGEGFTTQEMWQAFLTRRNITKETEIRLVTEAALFASIFKNGVPRDLNIHADDAGQFEIYLMYLSLCWIHEERHYRKIIPVDEQARLDLEQVRNKIWLIYGALKAYQKNPNESDKAVIEKQFDDLFLKLETSSPTLNHRLRLTHAKKQKLLRVLDKPDTPLHNNRSELDARSVVRRRKISGGTRSDEGRDCRDTFLSLKQTCLKLGINFRTFLKDRVSELYEIPKLADVIRQRSSISAEPI